MRNGEVMPIAPRTDISVEKIKELFDYFPLSGLLIWKANTGKRNRIGMVAGCIKDTGYVRIQLEKRMLLAHRVAWAIYYGEWPSAFIDHINSKREDNRIENLRSVTHQQNTMNSSVRSHNSTGFKGVQKQKYGFCARIVFQGRCIRLGYFKTPEEAHQAYEVAAKNYHDEFANTKNNATVDGR
jgi:HNH endonuclease